jgi:hypothetical protein
MVTKSYQLIQMKCRPFMKPPCTWRLTVYRNLINSAEKADMSIFRCYSSKRPERLWEVRKNSVRLNLGFHQLNFQAALVLVFE